MKLAEEIILEVKEEFPGIKCDYVLMDKLKAGDICLQISGSQYDIDVVHHKKMQRMIPIFCKSAGQMSCLISHEGWYRYLFLEKGL